MDLWWRTRRTSRSPSRPIASPPHGSRDRGTLMKWPRPHGAGTGGRGSAAGPPSGGSDGGGAASRSCACAG
jgi:hypothetical protein